MEQLKHECGVALVRLLKPLDYYRRKYGTERWGLNKLYLLMEKQHNRGQEGAGLAIVNLGAQPGDEYMFRERALGSGAIGEVFSNIQQHPEAIGELLMGHLRYSTTGHSGLSYVHPFLRRNNWRARNLALCGNFNMTNTDAIFEKITSEGQHPRINGDTYIILEQMGHRLDRESERVYVEASSKLGLQGKDVTSYIEEHIDVMNVLRTSAPMWDGGYVICGMTGSGEMFSMRDPWGIRPAFWYMDDEVFALASERPVLQTAFDLDASDIRELLPGEAVAVSKSGVQRTERIIEPVKVSPCSFERIYFSRGSDKDIYQERKMLGRKLTPHILKSIDGDVGNTVFSYIPNTAEAAFHGMMDGMREELDRRRMDGLLALGHAPTQEDLDLIFSEKVRNEKVAIKDIKMRTFITEESGRKDLSAHVYDITYGSLRPGVDKLVIIDDSIVRGTTLKESIIRILNRLHPAKIVIVSSAPQVRFPDWYGIDMSRLEEFIAFRAAVALLKEKGMSHVLEDIHAKCLSRLSSGGYESGAVNYVKEIYSPFSVQEISAKMVEMLRPEEVAVPIELVFQTVEGLRETCPDHSGDWYFSGDYPTPGGMKLLDKVFVKYYESESHNHESE